jgi:hypothetical protein
MKEGYYNLKGELVSKEEFDKERCTATSMVILQ